MSFVAREDKHEGGRLIFTAPRIMLQFYSEPLNSEPNTTKT